MRRNARVFAGDGRCGSGAGADAGAWPSARAAAACRCNRKTRASRTMKTAMGTKNMVLYPNFSTSVPPPNNASTFVAAQTTL